MIKAVFFDIDGTLISFKTHLVPDSTLNALKELKNKGVKIFISTGRSITNLGYLRQAVPIEFDGYIAMNGQYCWSGGKVVREAWIPVSEIKEFISYLDEKNLSCHFVELNYAYLNRLTPRVYEMRKTIGQTISDEPIDSTDRIYKHRVYQLSPYIIEEEEADALKYLPNCRAARWHPLFTDVIPATGGKSVGIHAMLKYHGIDISESMAFGDGGNDIEMLKFVGIGVAMGNASESVKASADYVSSDVDDDGIYKTLKRFNVL